MWIRCFGGGAFLATCFLYLRFELRHKLVFIAYNLQWSTFVPDLYIYAILFTILLSEFILVGHRLNLVEHQADAYNKNHDPSNAPIHQPQIILVDKKKALDDVNESNPEIWSSRHSCEIEALTSVSQQCLEEGKFSLNTYDKTLTSVSNQKDNILQFIAFIYPLCEGLTLGVQLYPMVIEILWVAALFHQVISIGFNILLIIQAPNYFHNKFSYFLGLVIIFGTTMLYPFSLYFLNFIGNEELSSELVFVEVLIFLCAGTLWSNLFFIYCSQCNSELNHQYPMYRHLTAIVFGYIVISLASFICA